MKPEDEEKVEGRLPLPTSGDARTFRGFDTLREFR